MLAQALLFLLLLVVVSLVLVLVLAVLYGLVVFRGRPGSIYVVSSRHWAG